MLACWSSKAEEQREIQGEMGRYGEIWGDILACWSSKAEEQKKRRQKGATCLVVWGGVARCGEIGEMWGGEEAEAEGRHLGGVARCGEMWGDVGRCGEMWRDVGRCGRCGVEKKRRQKGATCLVGQLGTMQ